MNNQKPPTVKEFIENGRTILLSTQANANTAAVNYCDGLANQLGQFVELSGKQEVEIQRLQELLRKNNIQFILPVESIKLPENKAVVREPELETPQS